MIAFLSGRVHSFSLDWVVIDNQGIGYRVFFNHPEVLSLNQQISLYTYHYIREDEQSLYGFLNIDEYDLFVKLISVKGLGCKTAANILAASDFQRIVTAIELSDVAYLKTMPGIGAKTASQEGARSTAGAGAGVSPSAAAATLRGGRRRLGLASAAAASAAG